VIASEQDNEHLRLLSLFHYVVGGLMALFSLFPIIHVGIGIFMMTHPGRFNQGAPSPFPVEWLGVLFAAVGAFVILCGWTLAGLTLFSGRCLARRKHRLFCTVVAGLNCMVVPIGTVLGVFTLLVLLRPSVKTLFS
jgi:hypothetical protein